MAFNRNKAPPQRPEAALQRAVEFINVGKDNDALNTLHEAMKQGRFKQWVPVHQDIMLQHMELCVKLRNALMAKDALHQYKTLTQSSQTIASLEKVMKHLLALAEEKTEVAQKESIEKVEEIDDLDSGAHETMLLSVVSGAVSQDRMDRTVLSPWLRFLWDSYRNCLEILKNNNLVEALYHNIVRQTFKFCIKFQRRNEFRKLCELLRNHLIQLQKNIANSSHNVNNQRINLSESLAIMQETRLHQLDTAIQMELWQEAYKSTEDLHNLMQLSKEKEKRAIKPQSFVNYFDKLSLIFWKGGNILFHSAALLQKFIIFKDMKRVFTEEEATEQATRVLLATLSIAGDLGNPSMLTKHLDMEDVHLGNIRILSTLLRLPIAPTRKGILREVGRLNIPEIANSPVANLYRLIEVEFAPLKAAKLVEDELERIRATGREDYIQYVPAIREVVATKIMKALASIYDAISIDRLSAIIPFYSRTELEHFLVHVTKQRILKAQVDHRDNSVSFGPIDATLSGDVETELGGQNAYAGGYESIRTHLTKLYELLGETAYDFDEKEIYAVQLDRFTNCKRVYEHRKNDDYDRIQNRAKIIEHHKENSEQILQQKRAKAVMEATRREELRRAEEMVRLKKEQEQNVEKRKKAEEEEVQRRIRSEKIKRFQQNPLYKEIIQEIGENALEDIDPETVIREQRERMDAERREQIIRMLQQERKYDYMVRAFNYEERAIYKVLAEERNAKAPELFAESEKKRVEEAHKNHEAAKAKFERLQLLLPDAKIFIKDVVASHRAETDKRIAEFDRKFAALREKKLAERRVQREKERRVAWEHARREERDAAIQEKKDAEREERNAVIQAGRQRRDQQHRGGDRDDRHGEDSKAEKDTNWRGSAAASGPPRRRGVVAPPPSIGPISAPEPPSAADNSNAWRSDAAPVVRREPHPPFASTPTRHHPAANGPQDGAKPAPYRPPVANTQADTASSWRTARAPAQQPQHQQENRSTPSPAPPAGDKPSQPAKYRPPSFGGDRGANNAQAGGGGGFSRSTGTPGPRGPGAGAGAGGPPPDFARGPRQTQPPRRDDRRQPQANSGGAEKGSWRS